jgi:hypothetical protein
VASLKPEKSRLNYLLEPSRTFFWGGENKGYFPGVNFQCYFLTLHNKREKRKKKKARKKGKKTRVLNSSLSLSL